MAGFFHRLWYGDTGSQPVATHSLDQIMDSIIAGRGLDALALSVASVFRARQLNADTMASLPVFVGDSPAPAPNVDQSHREFISEVVFALQDNGDAYVEVDARGEMRVLAYDHVNVEWNIGETRRIYTRSGTNIRFRTEGLDPNMYVITMNRGVHDLEGTGPMENPRIDGVLAEQAYSEEFFKHHGKPSGVLKVPSEPTSAEAKVIKAQWDDARVTRSTAIISQQMDYTATSFSPNDSEWTETHLIGIGDISSLFGVPASMLNYLPAGSLLVYQNIGDVYQGYWRMTLFPTYAKPIQDMWSKVLRQPVEFHPEYLFLASLKDRSTAAWQLVSMGFEPDAVTEAVGLPAMAHTGEIPTTLQEDSNATAG